MENFLRGHGAAFVAWQRVPRIALYDNLKSTVLERQGTAIRFNPTLLSLGGHYRFEPRTVAVARGNEKGRVERAIRYIGDAFFAGHQYASLDDLNAQAAAWVSGPTGDRRCQEDETLIAPHPHSYGRRQQIEIPEHIATLVDHKHQASAHRRTDHLVQAVAVCRDLLTQAVERGEPLGRTENTLTDLLAQYCGAELTVAIADALARGVPHPNAVRLVLERQRRAQDEPPPLTITLPEHVKRRNIPVRPHDLDGYDQLTENAVGDE